MGFFIFIILRQWRQVKVELMLHWLLVVPYIRHIILKVPLYPVVPIIAIASGVFVVVNQIFLAGHRSTVISIASIIVMLLGLPVYMIIKKRL